MSILGALHFYEKRKGWMLALCILNIAMYFSLTLRDLS